MSSWQQSLSTGVVLMLAAGCSAGPSRAASHSGKQRVAAAFYPVEYVARRVGADRVAVTALTKAGAEPHDVELSTRDVAAVHDADLVVYLRNFQPAVDDAVGKLPPAKKADIAGPARLDLRAGNTADPHFWLDPARLADVGEAVAARLAAADPQGEASYTAGAATLRKDLEKLDADITAGLSTCSGKQLLTTHTAFGYLAQRYGLTQVGIAGIDPESEPTAADQARAVEFAKSNGVSTVFTEPLVNDAIATSVAREIGGVTAVLDPVESISSKSLGNDYIEVMRSNLAALRSGLGCR